MGFRIQHDVPLENVGFHEAVQERLLLHILHGIAMHGREQLAPAVNDGLDRTDVHVKDLETLQKIIQYLRGEIVTAASPLPDAFWETGRRMRDPYRDFLQDISEDMRRPDGKTLPAILEENTAVHLADTRLTKEEKEELQEAGCGLGTGDRAMQKANLDRYEARLVQRIAELQKGLPERKRLCQSLGIMGGLFLFLILV